MKTSAEVGSDKLRGGFYTPARLVETCIDRISELNGHRSKISVLEPAVGDGAFLRGLTAHRLSANVEHFVGIEIIPTEARKCRESAGAAPFNTSIITGSALEWAAQTQDRFDVVLGNPPFVRYQFIPPSEVRNTWRLRHRLGLPPRGVSNLWIPVFLGALDRLRPGGSMAVVIPAEIFTGLSAGDARAWLLSNIAGLRVDMFEPGSFPGVLQEVVVVSGCRADVGEVQAHRSAKVRFVEHSRSGRARRCSHLIPQGTENWTRYLLSPAEVDALSEAQHLEGIAPLGAVARLEVSIVTGANDFFSVSAEELKRFRLARWAVPLLPRTRHAPGLVYTPEDHDATVASGAKAWLLDFNDKRPEPRRADGASRYLSSGENRGLHLRYKTRIRTPWYRVPFIWAGKLLLSKRSHRFPRLILNAAGVATTDTIYRGEMLPGYEGQELELVAAFHNSLTLLSAELEGRSFGGGVLELVPSEIARLSVPFPVGIANQIPLLDSIARDSACRRCDPELLVERTDMLLQERVGGLTPTLLQRIRDARESLLRRRLSRN